MYVFYPQNNKAAAREEGKKKEGKGERGWKGKGGLGEDNKLKLIEVR